MIPREFFCTVPTGPAPALLCGSRGKMSRKKGIFQEKHSPQKKNVPENATIPGENVVAVGKHPCFGGKTGKNHRRRGKMSRKTPQNVEEISPSSKTSSFHPRNVEEITAQRKMSWKPPQNRGKDVRFRRLSGTFVNVKTD